MASSAYVYDVAIDAIEADEAASSLGRLARRSGLRCWGAGWSTIPGSTLADELRFGVSASRMTVRVIGSCRSEADLERELAAHDAVTDRSSVVVLAPGCPVGPRDVAALPGATVIDWRTGLFEQREELLSCLLSSRLDADGSSGPGLATPAIKARVASSYDLIADRFASRWARHPPLQALDKFLRLLPRGAMVLDAGCGPGHHAAVLARGSNHVIGIDVSDGMLRIARRSVRRPRFLRMDMQHLTFPDRSFDGIWCAAAAVHVPREEIVAVLRGFKRALRPTGVLGLNLQVGRASEVVSHEGDIRFFEYYRDSDEVTRVAAEAGLGVIGSDYGETSRNTYGLDLTLRWATLYLKPLSTK